MSKSFKNWCFTSYKQVIGVDLQKSVFEGKVKGVIYQGESCPNTGKSHWQGYMELCRKTTMKKAKEALGDPAAHLEPRKGSKKQAMDYCRKLESRIVDPCTYGDLPEEEDDEEKIGVLQRICNALIDGVGLDEIRETFPVQWMMMRTRIIEFWNDLHPPRMDECDVTVKIGPTGCGKTQGVYRDERDVYAKAPNTKWWDGYRGQQVVLIDEFRGGIPIEDMLRILDRYPYLCEIKGGHLNLVATKFYICSNTEPKDWWPFAKPEDLAAFNRRVKTFVKFPFPGGVGGNTVPLPSSAEI